MYARKALYILYISTVKWMQFPLTLIVIVITVSVLWGQAEPPLLLPFCTPYEIDCQPFSTDKCVSCCCSFLCFLSFICCISTNALSTLWIRDFYLAVWKSLAQCSPDPAWAITISILIAQHFNSSKCYVNEIGQIQQRMYAGTWKRVPQVLSRMLWSEISPSSCWQL